MLQTAIKSVAVVMQRRAISNRWQSEVWEALAVLDDYSGPREPRRLVETAESLQWLYPALELRLHLSEAEGYYHNVSAKEPKVFVLWRMEEGRAVPQFATVSYDEASRWMDGGEQVDPVPMPASVFAWVGEFVEQNYRPAPKKRIKPQSFLSPKDRAR
ncbi:MAG TPA: DUF3305 domain-containing protein [Burkholderiales bacterium]|nr:DUF3305 domain-containing protein [Burkholderiales bacterium]